MCRGNKSAILQNLVRENGTHSPVIEEMVKSGIDVTKVQVNGVSFLDHAKAHMPAQDFNELKGVLVEKQDDLGSKIRQDRIDRIKNALQGKGGLFDGKKRAELREQQKAIGEGIRNTHGSIGDVGSHVFKKSGGGFSR
jgi:hypothetical protein